MMSDEKIVRKIAVIFVTDVVGFNKLMEDMKTKVSRVSEVVKKFWKTCSSDMEGGFSILLATPSWLNFQVPCPQEFFLLPRLSKLAPPNTA